MATVTIFQSNYENIQLLQLRLLCDLQGGRGIPWVHLSIQGRRRH